MLRGGRSGSGGCGGNAREAAYNWISLELEEEGDLPAQTHIDDMSLPEGSMVKQIMVRIKLLPDND